MKRYCQIIIFLSLTAMFTSCNFEKRLYRSGYYSSSPHSVNRNSIQKPFPDLVSEKRIRVENVKSTASINSTIEINRPFKSTQCISVIQKKLSRKGTITNHDKKITALNRELKNQNGTAILKEDEKIKKDVRGLLIGSIAVFIAAFLYELFVSSGVLWAANTLFILTPFSIIALWIFALLLYQKYAKEDQVGNSAEKGKQERIITRRKTFLLAGFLGIFGAHRFYLGYTEIAILEMLTLGGFFILWFIDFLRIKNGTLKPKKGNYDREDGNYKKGKVNKAPNRSQNLIKLAVLISLAALMIIFGFAIFF